MNAAARGRVVHSAASCLAAAPRAELKLDSGTKRDSAHSNLSGLAGLHSGTKMVSSLSREI